MNIQSEQLLIAKKYYQSLETNEDILKNILSLSSKLKQLGNKTAGNANEIRFAQAEIYWLLEDYEAAISKWENIKGTELSGWALKNIGDAYYELDMYEKAESSYLTVPMGSFILKIENLLSLYNLYIKENNKDKAHRIVNKLVEADFSYGNVSELALLFFEEIKDYLSAVTLVINRLEFSYDKNYISNLYNYLEASKDCIIPPSSWASELLVLLWNIDKNTFVSLFQTINAYYFDSAYFLDWYDCLFEASGKTDHQIIQTLLDDQPSIVYQSTDLLLSGTYSIADIKPIIENHLPKYYSICQPSPLKSSLGAILKAWEEAYPDSISETVLKDIAFTRTKIYRIENMNSFYSNMKKWLESIELDYDLHSGWWLDYWLADNNKKVMIAGSFSNGKSSFINSVLQEDILSSDQLPTTSAITIIQYGQTKQLLELKNSSISQMDLDSLHTKTTINHEQSSNLSNSLISLQVNVGSLLENSITLIDTPGFNDENKHNNPTYDHLYLADELLFLFNAETPYKKTEKEALLKMKERQPELPISFILNKADYLDEEEREEVLEDVERKLTKNFNQEIAIIPYSSVYPEEDEQQLLKDYFGKFDKTIYQRRIYKAIPYFNQFLTQFPKYLEAREQSLNSVILLRKKQLEGLGQIKQSFSNYKNEAVSQAAQLYIKNVVTHVYDEIKEQTLHGLRQFSNRLNINTNLDNVHLLLDQEMNNWLEANLTNTVIPLIYHQFGSWLQSNYKLLNSIELEMQKIRVEVEDMVNASQENPIFLEKRILIEKMKKSFQQTVQTTTYNRIDILNKINPLKSILNGVGRLLGGKSHTATLKIDQYRNYLETKSYEEATSQYLFNITKPLGTFEDHIRSEFNQIFLEFEDFLDSEIRSSKEDMIKHAQLLKNLYTEKDTYFETINIFKLKIRQLEIDYAGVNEHLMLTK
jgi:GTP-binding protein EngB required for normal cell division